MDARLFFGQIVVFILFFNQLRQGQTEENMVNKWYRQGCHNKGEPVTAGPEHTKYSVFTAAMLEQPNNRTYLYKRKFIFQRKIILLVRSSNMAVVNTLYTMRINVYQETRNGRLSSLPGAGDERRMHELYSWCAKKILCSLDFYQQIKILVEPEYRLLNVRFQRFQITDVPQQSRSWSRLLRLGQPRGQGRGGLLLRLTNQHEGIWLKWRYNAATY